MAKRSENQGLFNLETPAKPQGPVECLGMTFESDEAGREHFLCLLREGWRNSMPSSAVCPSPRWKTLMHG